MSWEGRVWRIVGIFTTAGCWWVAWSGGLLVMVVWGFLGVALFGMSWTVAAWFDMQKESNE